MIVEELVTKLGLELDEGAIETLEKFKELLHHGFEELGGFATVGAAALTAIVHSTAEAANAVALLSLKTGVGVEALQELEGAALLSQVSVDSLSMGLKFLQKNAVAAAEGSQEAVAAFAGVDFKDTNGHIKSADVLLGDVAAKFDGITDPAQQTALALKIFGRQGVSLLPMLKKGSHGIAELRHEAEELGFVMSEETVEAGFLFHEEIDKVELAFAGLRNTIGAPFIPVFTQALKGMVAVTQIFRKAIQDVGERLAKAFGPAMKYVTALMRKFAESDFAKALQTLASESKVLELALMGLAAIFTYLGIRAAWAALTTVATWALAAAPFILLALLIGIVIDEISNFIEGNDTLLGSIIKWAEMFDPNGNPILEFFKAAVALLFDFTDPKRWDRLIETFQKFQAILGTMFVQTFEWIGAKIAELLGSAIMGVINRFPLLKRLLGAQVDILSAGANAVGAGGVFDAAKQTAADVFGLGPGPKQSDQIAARLGSTASGLTSGNVSGPDLGVHAAPIQQTNNLTVHANGANPEEVVAKIKEFHDDRTREAHAAVGGGH